MAVTLSNIETLVRYLIDDNSSTMSPGDIFTYANSAVFTLTEANVISVSSVLKNDVALTVTDDYTYNSAKNQVTVTASLISGDTVEVQHTYYPNYSSSEIQNYIQGALLHISVTNYYDFKVVSSTVYPEPTEREKNLIAFITAIMIKPDNKTYRLPDMSIQAPNDLPTNEKILKTIAIFKRANSGTFFIA